MRERGIKVEIISRNDSTVTCVYLDSGIYDVKEQGVITTQVSIRGEQYLLGLICIYSWLTPIHSEFIQLFHLSPVPEWNSASRPACCCTRWVWWWAWCLPWSWSPRSSRRWRRPSTLFKEVSSPPSLSSKVWSTKHQGDLGWPDRNICYR